ncbi:MAG: transposase [Candidatus Aenigmarchaeota archaeon]|nr:transposase [Candidatus Aenigmarchaeota archaeon]
MYSKGWGELCRDVGVQPIHTRPYHPQCNGKAEAVVKKAKAFLNRHVVEDLAHANRLLGEFQWETNRTPHSGLKYQTPLQVYRAKRRAGDIWGVT